MIYGHRKEFKNFQKNIPLSPSFPSFGRLVMEKIEPWEKNKEKLQEIVSFRMEIEKRME